MSDRIRTGVIGVGQMGQHHARVYSELAGANLIGVADASTEQAQTIADEYDTAVYTTEEVIEAADAVSIAVPTESHYEIALSCLDAGTHMLVEKPFVETKQQGRELMKRADETDVTIQVGHIERFNPVIDTLQQLVPDLNVISITAERLGPGPNRPIRDSAVMDLMIHDIDVITSLIDAEIDDLEAYGNADGRHATATIEFTNHVIGTLTASRVTQRKVRKLSLTAQECYVTVDYMDQSIEIHRQSTPEYISTNGGVQFRRESLVETPVVENGEPLKRELESFLYAIRIDCQPRVPPEDGIQSLRLAKQINDAAFGTPAKRVPPEVSTE